MAAGQRDIPVLLQPGSGATVRAPGEFMYLAFADREILAIVTGLDGTQSRLKMVTGDFTKPAGGIEEVELVNPDPDNACAVTVIIGAGEFDRKIIQGDVTVTPVLRSANGKTKADTRTTIELQLDFTEALNVEWEQHEEKETVGLSGAPDGEESGFVFCATPSGYITATPINSADTLNYFSRDGVYQRSVAIFDIPEPLYPGSPMPTGTIKGVTYNPWTETVWFVTSDGNLFEVVGRGPGLRTGVNLAAMVPAGALAGPVGVAFVSASQVAVAVSGGIWFIDVVSGAAVGNVETPDTVGRSVAYVPELDGVAYCSVGNRLPRIVYLSGEIEDLPVAGSVNGAGYDYKSRQYVLNELYGNLRVHSAGDVSYFAAGSAIRTECGAVSAVLRRGEERIESAVYVIDDGGEITVSGQLIRAALELYGGGQPMPDYLDSVYAFQVLGQTVSVETGGSSFAAAKQADEFTMMAPAIVRLTIDNDMTWS